MLSEKMHERLRILGIVAVALLLRWCVACHPYSGQGKPPMYGDYEAQRHWQEITLNLPVEQWYTNSTDNDLEYWGLDYPPLTAYHSLLLALVVNRTNREFVALRESRGYESDGHKYFMRLTVLLADLLIYIPAVLWFVRGSKVREGKKPRSSEGDIFGSTRRDRILAAALTYPGLMLIDHGHFQYNCVSLGFFVAAVTATLRNSTTIGSFLFALALNYKQMELYHALPFFFYILGSNTPGREKALKSCLRELISVALTVLVTFAVVWTPFLRHESTFFDALSRLFPFARGVFEDKVANVWCSVNVLYKLRDAYTNAQLARICLATTTAAVLPSCVDLYLKPSKEKFSMSLVNSALAFFLFSFQVHEKSVLLVAIPIVLHFHEDPLICFWFSIVSTFSMLPLFLKDDLFLAFAATTAFYFVSIRWMFANALFKEPVKMEAEAREVGKRSRGDDLNYEYLTLKGWCFSKEIFHASMFGMLLLTLASAFLAPPRRYPDLYPLLISIYSCGHFLLFFFYFNCKQICTTSRHSDRKLKAK